MHTLLLALFAWGCVQVLALIATAHLGFEQWSRRFLPIAFGIAAAAFLVVGPNARGADCPAERSVGPFHNTYPLTSSQTSRRTRVRTLRRAQA